MIRVNLLESVTDRNGGSVAAVEARVSSPRGRGLLALLVVAGLLVAGVTFDWVSARGARAEAMAELQRQQEVQTRIDAIKKLRAAQQGPVAVLSAVNDRLPRVADFRLESIEQKGDDLIVKGDSPDEAAVTQFGRS